MKTDDQIVKEDDHLSISMSIARDIVVAYLAQRAVEPDQLAKLVRDVRAALELRSFDVADATAPSRPEPAASPPASAPGAVPQPAVPVDASITPDFIISLEDGKPYRSLKRHLMARHGLTPDQYREKWGLPADYPMVAPNYARDRSEVAKRIGLGKSSASRASAALRKRAD